MSCTVEKCLSSRSCEILGECVFDHDLVAKGNLGIELESILKELPVGAQRTKAVVDFLQRQQPPKVSGEQIRKWNRKKRKAKNRALHQKAYPLIVQNSPQGD